MPMYTNHHPSHKKMCELFIVTEAWHWYVPNLHKHNKEKGNQRNERSVLPGKRTEVIDHRPRNKTNNEIYVQK